MDSDIFFSSPRWKILEIIAKKPSSPMEISKELKTSVAYVSQQLKLLEAANIVKKEKTGASEKGKPRMIFSLSKEIVHLSILMENYPAKKLICLNSHHKAILGIWLLDNEEMQHHIEKLYWKLEEDLKEIKGFFIEDEINKLKVIIVTESKKVKSKIDSFLKEFGKTIDCIIINEEEFRKSVLQKIHPVYDPNKILLEKKVKGGEGNDVK